MRRSDFAALGALVAVGLVWWARRPSEPPRPAAHWQVPGIPAQARPSRLGALPLPMETAAPSDLGAGGGVLRAPPPDARDAAMPATSLTQVIAGDKLASLEDVLRAGNDNDPRIDREFNALSLVDRRRFRAKYERLDELAPEHRNDLGMIVFLLGKNLRDGEDWAFLRRVVQELPCLSMEDCAKPPAKADDEGNVAITLVYPQLVALAQAQRVMKEGGSGSREALSVLQAGAASPSPLVSRKAASILSGR